MRKSLLLAVALLALMFMYYPGESSAQPKAAGVVTGKVIETMDSGGYTYVHIQQKDGKKVWLAMPQIKAEKGKTMSFQGGDVMPSYTSKTLKRTFENIIFSPGPVQ